LKEVRENLSGKWTIHWAPLVILLPISVLIEPVIRTPDGESFLWTALTSFLGYLTLLAFLALSWFLVYRKGNANWLFIFPISFVAGYILSQSNDFYNRLFDLSQTISFAPGSTVLAWGLGLPVVGYVMNKLESFVRTRDSLVSELLELDEPKLEFSLDEEFRKLLTSRDSIDQSGYSRLAEKLQEFTDTEVRPLSHKMWVGDLKTKSRFPFWSLVRLAIANNPLPAFLYSVVALWLVGLNAIQQFGLTAGGFYFLIDVVVFVFTLFIFKRIPIFAMGINAFLFPAIATTLMMAERVFVRPELNTDQFIFGWLVLWVWLFTSLVLTGGVVEAIKTQRQVLDDLERDLRAGQQLSYLQQEIKDNGSEDLAKFIHGTVQSKLMSYSLRMKLAVEQGDIEQAMKTRQDAKQLIENPLAEYQPSSNKPIQERLSQLSRSWRGLVDFSIHYGSIHQSLWQAIEDIVSEGITNAHKHGFATKVDVQITKSGEFVEVEITDDGIGPRQSGEGYGLRMVNTHSSGNWSFGASADGKGSTLKATLPLVVIND
jgi:signal transduction histidine kinase